MKLLFAFLLFSVPAFAQVPPRPAQTPVAGKISGTVRVPAHHWVLFVPVRNKGWRRVTVKLPKHSDPRLAVVWIEDVDHPISSPDRPGDPNWQLFDPRAVAVTASALTFDAVAGDHVWYRVGWIKDF